MMLGPDYWSLRDYITSFYPRARIELVRLEDVGPLYMRVEIDHAEVAALQGLDERLTMADGRRQERAVAQVDLLDGTAPEGAAVEWEGTLRVERGGEYELRGEGGLQLFVDGSAWEGRHHLGRGLYRLRIERPAGAAGAARLLWQPPEQLLGPVPPEALFRVRGPRQGLLGAYYSGMGWEGEPLFQQITPFLFLSWPDEARFTPDGSFSARFSGSLRIVEPGSYRLRVEADDGARLTLDGVVVGEELTLGRANSFELTVALEPGDHALQIDYVQQGGGSALQLLWSRDGEPLSIVPPSALVPAQP
jgi:hypothetical protein